MWPPPSQVRGRPMRRYAPWPESSRNIAPAARRRAAVCRWHAFDSSPEGCRSPCPTDISIQIRRYDQTLVARSNSPDRDSVFLWRSALLPPVVSFVSRTITGHTTSLVCNSGCMTLLREIQQAAVDPNVDITTVLRKARILAARLKNAEFEEWVERELNGYPDKAGLPAYRILGIESRAHLIIGWQQLTRATVMPSRIPEQFRHWATTAHLSRSITEYASLVSSCEGNNNTTLQSPWPQDLAVRYGGGGYNEAQCLRAWQEIGKDSLVALIETSGTGYWDLSCESRALRLTPARHLRTPRRSPRKRLRRYSIPTLPAALATSLPRAQA